MTLDGPDPAPLQAELTRRFDGSALLGYLNFSDGRPDPKFRKAVADVFTYLEETSAPIPWNIVSGWLAARLEELHTSGAAAFKDATQARETLPQALVDLPQRYRQHHSDLLAHQSEATLFTPFFLARCCESILTQRAAGKDGAGALRELNDFVGYRPIALLETRPQTEYYPHEKVCPVPLYFRGSGTAPGRYAAIVRPALDLLEKTDPEQLREACFDPARLDELAFDPRAVDHFHPVNKRPSVLFGEWDPHRIDPRGFYRRFVLRQLTLEALTRWIDTPTSAVSGSIPAESTRAERIFEAAAALCGTVLMGAGVCGTGPTHYDSSIDLNKLIERIARYRDEFYKRLLVAVPGAHGERLRSEASRLKQPFAAVRQHLNHTIAVERAVHLQERRLAVLFASMGYPSAARARAALIPAPAARFSTEIRLRQTEVEAHLRTGNGALALKSLAEIEDFLRRGIECGALIDPWNILGYQGLFPIYPGRDDTVRDPRAEDLILTVGRQFDLYARGLATAAAAADRATEMKFHAAILNVAGWWDRYATSAVSDLPRVIGSERKEAAEHVAEAMALWKSGGAGDPAFWRKHIAGFKTSPAFAQVVDALLAHGDHRAAMALLATWLSEAEQVPLQEPNASFYRLAFRWVHTVAGHANLPAEERSTLIRRFFELLEANADSRWEVPQLEPRRDLGDKNKSKRDDEFEAAYEGMTYRDSTDDGEESSVAEGSPTGPIPGEFELDEKSEQMEENLRFLAAVARLWRTIARPDLWPTSDSGSVQSLGDWLATARNHVAGLKELIDRLHETPIPEPEGEESAVEFDRRRSLKSNLLELAVQTLVETAAAARGLAALLSRNGELSSGEGSPKPQPGDWETAATRLERAVASGDPSGARRKLAQFLPLFRSEPLLVCPPADGGTPAPAIRAQNAMQMVESLLARLPRLGLLRETYQLAKLARLMERNDPPEGRRVSSFDQLFRTAMVGVVDSLLIAARDWGEDAGEDGPLASAIRQVTESFQTLWVDHSAGLRLSALESALDKSDWEPLKAFIRNYGGDLFTVKFLKLSNIRGILGQGATVWLDREAAQIDERPAHGSDPRPPAKLVLDWADGVCDRAKAARNLEIVLQSIVEHYDEYRDYNTTTTQSDYGENLYILLDFLRLKVDYDRYLWRLRPLVVTHEMLCRRGFDRLAAKWRGFIAARTDNLTTETLATLAAREAEHAVKLRTVRDRLEEGFIQPLRIDLACARVARAHVAAREGQPEENPSFAGLLSAIQPLAAHPSGVGLDVPVWLKRLDEELRKTRAAEEDGEEEDGDVFEQYPFPAPLPLDFAELKRQLQEWEKPIEGT